MPNVKGRFIDGKIYMIMIHIWTGKRESDTSAKKVADSRCDWQSEMTLPRT